MRNRVIKGVKYWHFCREIKCFNTPFHLKDHAPLLNINVCLRIHEGPGVVIGESHESIGLLTAHTAIR